MVAIARNVVKMSSPHAQEQSSAIRRRIVVSHDGEGRAVGRVVLVGVEGGQGRRGG